MPWSTPSHEGRAQRSNSLRYPAFALFFACQRGRELRQNALIPSKSVS
ncbi:Uncharacterised protein [Bordetella pertussis]|nr:Uncharacterised protein [Bordetella pertussis]